MNGSEDGAVRNLSRGQLARAAGLGLETIRFYEKQGLLPAPRRTASGYRQYSPNDLSRLNFIGSAKRLGFTLQETGELLSIGKHPHVVCPNLRGRAEEKIRSIESKIQELSVIRQMLIGLVECCKTEQSDCKDEHSFCANLIALGAEPKISASHVSSSYCESGCCCEGTER